jgi:putative transcriptional regulator
MAIVRHSRIDIDRDELLKDLAARSLPSEAEIEAQAAEDGDAWTPHDVARAVPVMPSSSAKQVRELRRRLGLSQAQFARKFGFAIDTIRQYEQGRRMPSGPASTLLRVIEAEPDVVIRALGKNKAG